MHPRPHMTCRGTNRTRRRMCHVHFYRELYLRTCRLLLQVVLPEKRRRKRFATARQFAKCYPRMRHVMRSIGASGNPGINKGQTVVRGSDDDLRRVHGLLDKARMLAGRLGQNMLTGQDVGSWARRCSGG